MIIQVFCGQLFEDFQTLKLSELNLTVRKRPTLAARLFSSTSLTVVAFSSPDKTQALPCVGSEGVLVLEWKNMENQTTIEPRGETNT